MYTADLIALVEQHGFCPHMYADDTQIYGSTRPPAIHDFQQRLSACIDDVHTWMSSNRLQLNTNKTELALVCHCSPSAPTATICIQDWAA